MIDFRFRVLQTTSSYGLIAHFVASGVIVSIADLDSDCETACVTSVYFFRLLRIEKGTSLLVEAAISAHLGLVKLDARKRALSILRIF